MQKVIYLILLFTLAISVKSQSLPNINLLQTTRAEIEKMFGDKYELKDGFCTYSTDEGIYYFYYSTAPCKPVSVSWNVPKDTLLGYNFEPKKKENFQFRDNKELIVVGWGYHIWGNYYIDENKGIIYSVNSKNVLEAIKYSPTSNKKALWKKEFQPYSIAGLYYYPFKYFYTKDKRLLEKTLIIDPPAYHRLDNSKSYFVGYTINNYSPAELKKYLKRLSNIAFVKKKFSKKMVEIIYGGNITRDYAKDDFEIQLLIIPNNYPPPVPDPERWSQN